MERRPTGSKATASSVPEAGLAPLVQSLPIGLVLLDHRGRVVLYNHEEARLSGREVDEPIGKDFFREVAPCTNVQELGERFRRVMETGEPLDVDLEFTFPFATGPLDVRIRMRKVVLDDAPHGVLLIDDNTRLKATERALVEALEEARRLALRDPLTDLYNRRHFREVLPGELKEAHRTGEALSLILLDIDHFKRVNDRHGHLVGDAVLVRVAATLAEVVRSRDVAVRWGGEELCVLLPHTDGEAALRTAERVREAITSLAFEEAPGLEISLSIGVATRVAADGPETVPLSRETVEREAERLVALTDRCLYEGKRSGRGVTTCVSIWAVDG